MIKLQGLYALHRYPLLQDRLEVGDTRKPSLIVLICGLKQRLSDCKGAVLRIGGVDAEFGHDADQRRNGEERRDPADGVEEPGVLEEA